MSDLISHLQHLKEAKHVCEQSIDVLPVYQECNLVFHHGQPYQVVQKKALQNYILPLRYLRNFGTVGLSGQLRLLDSTVGIVGAGGLGGLIAELLARMGVGNLILIDEDCFEDNNLNRQLFCTEGNLGKSKVEAARERISSINCAVSMSLHAQRLTLENGQELLSPCSIVMDALDNVSSRFVLQKTARALDIPMVHGAIGGFLGQVSTIFPQDEGLYAFYPEGEDTADTLAETIMGNPAATPAMVAAWQAQEATKYIAGVGELLRNRMLFLDAQTASVEILEY